jgi:hypothetical protein
MTLDPTDRTALERMVEELRSAHGDDLISVSLTGDAVGPEYQARKTPLTTVIVLRTISQTALQATRKEMRRWKRRNIATPTLMDLRYIESSLDVFPIEFLDLADRHLLLFGDDPFADLTFDEDHLRLEVEEQLRGKLLHLWSAYLGTAGSERELRALLEETPGGFEVVLRGLARLRSHERLSADQSPIEAIERLFEIELPVLQRLHEIRVGRGSLANDELETVFDGYLGEVRRLVQLTDAH